MFNLKNSALAAVAAVAFAAPAAADETMTVVENAAGASDFSTLVAAVQAAGLADALMGEGPFTVFAPTNDAFAKLPEGTVETLLLPENIEMLQSLLSAHVVSGNIMMSDFQSANLGSDEVEIGNVNAMVEDGKIMLDTLTTADLIVEKRGDTFYVTSEIGTNDISEIIGEVPSSNGTIHIIDTVLSPQM